MKKFILLIPLIGYSFFISAQQKLKISGKLLNCNCKFLEFIPNGDSEILEDSIAIQDDGTFSYQIDHVKKPFRANLTNRKQIQIQLLMAPGYDLQINADVKDIQTIWKTLTYSGTGSASNKYWEQKPGNDVKPDTVKWYLKDEATYVAHLRDDMQNRKKIDEIFNAKNKDSYSGFFKRSFELDKHYSVLLDIFTDYVYFHKYNATQTSLLIKKALPDFKWADLNKEENLSSGAFNYLVTDVYPNTELGKSRATGKNTEEKLISLYQGKILDYVLFEHLQNKIPYEIKFEGLEKLKFYINPIKSNYKKESLSALIENRRSVLFTLQKGKPAPYFELPDTSGIMHSLAALKGKVLYIDLWASWCVPCREENPYMKNIYENYKNNDKVAFISIAVSDNQYRKNRYKLLNELKPQWLQLEDQKDTILKNYYANAIPRFIVIDKTGNIVDADAPRPSNKNELKALLDTEILK